MIRLTRANGTALYINHQYLITVEFDEDYNKTLVSTSTIVEGWYVLESPEEVARKVLEWRLAMERYRIAGAEIIKQKDAQWLFDDTEVRLKRIAGLEEPNHE